MNKHLKKKRTCPNFQLVYKPVLTLRSSENLVSFLKVEQDNNALSFSFDGVVTCLLWRNMQFLLHWGFNRMRSMHRLGTSVTCFKIPDTGMVIM